MIAYFFAPLHLEGFSDLLLYIGKARSEKAAFFIMYFAIGFLLGALLNEGFSWNVHSPLAFMLVAIAFFIWQRSRFVAELAKREQQLARK